MLTWYAKILGDGVTASAPRKQIMDAFSPVFGAAGCPIDMALFSRMDHNVVTMYFTPQASDFGKLFGAVPCEQPPREGTALLIGDQRAWEHFYPVTL